MHRSKRAAAKSLLLLIIFPFLIRCNSVSDGSEVVSGDGSVPVVVTFLKKHYLKDPDSYKSVEWGKLEKHSDGCYLVRHRFSGKNGFGAYDTETLLFYISPDGQKVEICSPQLEQKILIDDKEQAFEKENAAYLATDFTNSSFHGDFSQTIDGLEERYTSEAMLSKNGSKITGTLTVVETQIKYQLTGDIVYGTNADFVLRNLSTGSSEILHGKILLGTIYGINTNQTFHLNQN